jgi:hypothetical protein
MPAAHPLLFVLAPAETLASELLTSSELSAVQSQGVACAFALRIVVVGDLSGRLKRVCDAVTPCFQPERLWLGVYRCCANNPDQWQQLDRFPLSEANNETCWFYPTHNGTYLSWQRELTVTLGPGQIVDPKDEQQIGYHRESISLLWSLLADNKRLTCVGLTYAGRRIDWPLLDSAWSGPAYWSEFAVDNIREQPLVVHRRWEVGLEPVDEAT